MDEEGEAAEEVAAGGKGGSGCGRY